MAKISLVISDEGWIMEKFAREIFARVPNVSVGKEPDHYADLIYYLPYSAYKGKRSAIQVVLFTHLEKDPGMREKFFSVAKAADFCICISSRYEKILRDAGIEHVTTIKPGVDLDAYRPGVKVGVVGRTYHTGRKGESLVGAVMDEPGIEWHFTGSGWPGLSRFIPADEMPEFYRSMDYILVPSYSEGGPMCVLEALACGCEVIAPDVGFVPDYPHIEYKTGDAGDLRRVLHDVVSKRQALANSVADCTWDRWASEHAALFGRLLPSGLPRETKSDLSAEDSSVTDRIAVAKDAQVPRPGSSRYDVVLCLHGSERTTKGGPTVRAARTAHQLNLLGAKAEVIFAPEVKKLKASLAHVFNAWPAKTALELINTLHREGIPIVFSPIFLDLSELHTYEHVPEVFRRSRSPQKLESGLEAIRARPPSEGDEGDDKPLYETVPGYFDQVCEMVETADSVIFVSDLERRLVANLGAQIRQSAVIYNSVDGDFYGSGDPRIFHEMYGIKDYVLCVGRIESRKNQLLLAYALRNDDVPLVFIGHEGSAAYGRLVREHSGANAHFIDYLPPDSDVLASAYAGARVFVLPSWSEGAPLAALEAAAAGTRMVLSNRSAEREYFGDFASYCDPADPAALRKAVLDAFETPASPEQKAAQQRLVQENYNAQRIAAQTLGVYRSTLANRKAPRPARKPRPDLPIYVDVTSSAHAIGLPTGMLRVELMTAKELARKHPDRVRLCVWNGTYRNFYEVTLDQVEDESFKDIARGQKKAGELRDKPMRTMLQRVKETAKSIVLRLPPEMQPTAVAALRAYWSSVSETIALIKFALRGMPPWRLRVRSQPNGPSAPAANPDVRAHKQVGHVPEIVAASIFEMGAYLFIPGGGWVSNLEYIRSVVSVVRKKNLRLAAIIFDLLPVDCPHFFPERIVNSFTSGLTKLVKEASLLLSISEYTSKGLQEFAERRRISPPPIETFRLGDSFAREGSPEPVSESVAGLENRRFALAVSTLSPRKNHQLLYQIWRRLIAEDPEGSADLVIAGSAGWEVNNFVSVVKRDELVAGRIQFLGGVCDGDLDWLYRNCLFTVYPSLCEGWGLPVAESLNYGKVCVSSNASSMPEVAPSLTVLIDPLDFAGWYKAVKTYSYDDRAREALEAKIRREYRTTSWAAAADHVWAAIDGGIMSSRTSNRSDI